MSGGIYQNANWNDDLPYNWQNDQQTNLRGNQQNWQNDPQSNQQQQGNWLGNLGNKLSNWWSDMRDNRDNNRTTVWNGQPTPVQDSNIGYADRNNWSDNYDRDDDYDRHIRPTHSTYRDRDGRICTVTCSLPPRPRPHPRPRQSLIGLTVDQARRYYNNIRVVIADGNHLPVTQDYRPDRINVETRNGIIIRIVSRG